MDYEQVLLDQQELAKDLLGSKIIERDLSRERVLRFLKHPNVVAIMGVRRSGKTIFALKCLENKPFFYINFDDERLYNLKTEELNTLLKLSYKLKNYKYLILDEIQNIRGWELFVNRVRNTMRIIITGSNSNLLGKELSTHLTGRHVDLYLFPFSFREHLQFKGIRWMHKKYFSTKEKAVLLKELEDYLRHGGFPERYKFGSEILRFLFEDILIKDIIKREQIKKIREFEKFTLYLLSNVANRLSVKNIAQIMHLNAITVNKWLKALENSFLIYPLTKFSFKTKELLRSHSKIYVVDTGFITTKSFQFSENKGKLMENCVFLELLRKRYYHPAEKNEIYYYADPTGRYEVDFVIKAGPKVKELVQVTYANSCDDIKEREVRALLHAKEDLGLGDEVRLTVITWDYEDEKVVRWWRKEGRIRFVPMWKWLLH